MSKPFILRFTSHWYFLLKINSYEMEENYTRFLMWGTTNKTTIVWSDKGWK
jgi:hypothetical protein